MSFAVLHMQKIKTSGVKGIQFHNQRERESKTNPDIDKNRSHLNYDLHNAGTINYNEKVKQIIADHVITNRAIRKDAVKMCNFIISSDKAFFEGMSQERQKEFFEKAYEFFKTRYDEKHIVACPVHLDEHTPHMHLSLVPITADNKLSAKRMFDRKELRTLQDDFPKHMQENGFDLERGIDAEGKNKHLTVMEYKKQALSQDVNSLAEELRVFQEHMEEIQDTKLHMDKVDSIQAKSAPLSRGKVLVSKEDFEHLKTLVKKLDIVESKAKAQDYKIERLEGDLKNYKSDFNKLYQTHEDLKRESKLKSKQAQTKSAELSKEVSEAKTVARLAGQYLQSIGKFDEFAEKLRENVKQSRDQDVKQRKPKPKSRDHGLSR